MGKVWDDSECCDWMVEDQAIELGDNVGATLVFQYDDEGTKISCTHFAIERLLDSGISDEDWSPSLKVYLTMVVACSCSKQIVALIRAV